MNLVQAIKERNSVREYEDLPLHYEEVFILQKKIDEINLESGLSIQLICNEPKAFTTGFAKYGRFINVDNYIAMVGDKSKDLDEICGYYGEQLVLIAQQLGLNTCWVALTYSKIKEAYQVEKGQKIVIVIAIGHSDHPGYPHKSKAMDKLCRYDTPVMPEWFKKGVELAMLAPTALNQQKFLITLKDDKVSIKAKFGPCSKIDLGIVKYHFELGSGYKF